MDYDGMYVKLADDPTYWAVDDGSRRRVESQEEMGEIGLRTVRVITPETLEEIPLADLPDDPGTDAEEEE